MVPVSERLKQKATRRTAEVDIDGDLFSVIEIDAVDFSEYGAISKDNRREAVAFVLSRCVLDESGQPCLSIEDAREVAMSVRVSVPLVSKIMELSGFGGDEKKSDAS